MVFENSRSDNEAPHREDGTDPDKELLVTRRLWSFNSDPMLNGIEPTSLLLFRYTYCKLPLKAKWVGMLPDNDMYDKSK